MCDDCVASIKSEKNPATFLFAGFCILFNLFCYSLYDARLIRSLIANPKPAIGMGDIAIPL